jgi:hypothetical protein
MWQSHEVDYLAPEVAEVTITVYLSPPPGEIKPHVKDHATPIGMVGDGGVDGRMGIGPDLNCELCLMLPNVTAIDSLL